MNREEAVYRQDVLDLAKKGILVSNGNYESVCKAINELPSVNPQPCEDAISRKSIKQKLQEHHDFFVNAYGGFSNLPQNDKSRVDEITNCIAMVVNEPSVNPQPKTGHWILTSDDDYEYCTCSECGYQNGENWMIGSHIKFCQECGAKMVESQESEG